MKYSVTGNVFFNILGRVWSSVLQFLAIPVLIGLLGTNAYGLVGFNTMLIMALSFLNQGLNSSLVRELGRLGGGTGPDAAQDMRDLLRSLELPVIALGLVLGGGVALLAPVIARDWLNVQGLSVDHVISALRLLGIGLAFQWPSLFYSGGYVGLHRQKTLAPIILAQITGLYGGAVILLALVSSRVEVFFAWQAVVSLATTVVMRQRLLAILPPSPAPGRFDPERLRTIWRFSAGTMLVGLTASLLTQADTIMVSRAVPLDQFAAYSMSFSLASLIVGFVTGPISSVMLPLLSGLQSPQDRPRLAEEYHRWTQVAVFAGLPLAGPLIAFSRPLLEIWLGYDSPLIPVIWSILPWIVAGTMLNVIAMPPVVLQFSAGWTRLSVVKNFIILPPFLAALAMGIPAYGMIVGAWCWVAVNLAYYLFEVPVMHRRLLPRELWRWWGGDTLLPVLLAALIFIASVALFPVSHNRWFGFAQAATTSLAVVAALLVVLPYPRALVRELLVRAVGLRRKNARL